MNRPSYGATPKTFPSRLAAALLVCLTTGCIENPGPDPLLGVPKPASARVAASFQNARVLEFLVTREPDRNTLKVTNIGPDTIETATFHLEFPWNEFQPYYQFASQVPIAEPLEYFGTVYALAPGASQDFGKLEVFLSSDFGRRKITPSIIQLSMNGGARKGSRFAGVVRGHYVVVDTLGDSTSGGFRGMINADGMIRFGLFDDSHVHRFGVMTGKVMESGSLTTAGWAGHLGSSSFTSGLNPTGSFGTTGKGFSAAYSFSAKSPFRFTKVDLLMEPYTVP